MFQDGLIKSILSKVSRRGGRAPEYTGRVSYPPSPRKLDMTRLYCFPSVPSQQFQVLFNSLFKVLFIFPSRYLFAIGLLSIFSFGWNLPPALSCNPKQLDSLIGVYFLVPPIRTGLSPSTACRSRLLYRFPKVRHPISRLHPRRFSV